MYNLVISGSDLEMEFVKTWLVETNAVGWLNLLVPFDNDICLPNDLNSQEA